MIRNRRSQHPFGSPLVISATLLCARLRFAVSYPTRYTFNPVDAGFAVTCDFITYSSEIGFTCPYLHMRRVYSTRTGLEAHNVRLFLESRGIPTKVFGDNNALEVGFALTPATEPAVFVAEADFDRATELLEHYPIRIPAPRGTWKCAGCGETIEDQFDTCWNCQTQRNVEPTDIDPNPLIDIASNSEVKADDSEVDPARKELGRLAQSRWLVWIEVLVVIAISQPHLLGGRILSWPADRWPGDWTFVVESAWIIVAQLLPAAIILLLIYRNGESWSSLGLRRPSPWDFLGAGLLYYVTAWIVSIGNDLLLELLQGWFHTADVYRLLENSLESIRPHGGRDLLVSAVTSICIGFSEELVYRGYFISRLEQLLRSTWVSVLVAAIVFAAAHSYQGVDGVWNALLVGILFGVVFTYFRRLWPLAIAHALIDFVVMLRHGSEF